jgi:hypothetical protein
MSRSYKDAVGGHWDRDVTTACGITGWTPNFRRFAKRHNRRLDRRNKKPDTRCPELIYPYIYLDNQIIFDFSEQYDWEDDYDWYCDMLEEYWASQYDDEPDYDPCDYDYDPWDYDYDY